MLQKTLLVDSVTADLFGVLSIRAATVISEDGVELSRSYHRTTLAPGSDLAGQGQMVIAVATAVWTPEVIQAYQDRLAGEG
jgi:hypothetical protein